MPLRATLLCYIELNVPTALAKHISFFFRIALNKMFTVRLRIMAAVWLTLPSILLTNAFRIRYEIEYMKLLAIRLLRNVPTLREARLTSSVTHTPQHKEFIDDL